MDLITVSPAFGGTPQIEEAAVPGGNLDSLVAQRRRPMRNLVSLLNGPHHGKLGQKWLGLDCFHRVIPVMQIHTQQHGLSTQRRARK